jgi:hypothetical protein
MKHDKAVLERFQLRTEKKPAQMLRWNYNIKQRDLTL